MIPPSVPLVIYAILTQESIGKLFMAAVLPGIIAMLGACDRGQLAGRQQRGARWTKRYRGRGALRSRCVLHGCRLHAVYNESACESARSTKVR